MGLQDTQLANRLEIISIQFGYTRKLDANE